jgi:hypothetical protein
MVFDALAGKYLGKFITDIPSLGERAKIEDLGLIGKLQVTNRLKFKIIVGHIGGDVKLGHAVFIQLGGSTSCPYSNCRFFIRCSKICFSKKRPYHGSDLSAFSTAFAIGLAISGI